MGLSFPYVPVISGEWSFNAYILSLWQLATIRNIVLSWFIGWYLVYIVSGLYVQFFYIRDGINFRGITIKKRHSTTKIRKIRLKLGWGRVLIEAENIETQLHSKSPKSSGSSSGASKHKTQQQEPYSTSHNDRGKDAAGHDIVSVLTENRILRPIGAFFLRRVPSVDIKFKSVTIKLSEHQQLQFPFSQFRLDSKASAKGIDSLKFSSDIQIHEASYAIVNLESTRIFIPVNVDILRLQLSCLIDQNNGNVSRIKSKFLVDDLSVNVFESFQFLHEVGLFDIDNLLGNFVGGGSTSSNTGEAENVNVKVDPLVFDRKSDLEAILEAPDSVQLKKQPNSIWKKLSRFYSKVEEVDFRFQNMAINDILLINFNEEFEIESLFKSKRHNSLNLVLKGLSVSANRIHTTGAGFFILFNSVKDYPFHFTLALQMLSIRYNHLHKDDTMEMFEIFNLPNFSISNKANVLNHLVTGKGFKDSVIEFYAATGSPTIDIDIQRLAVLIYNLLMLKKYIKVKQLQRLNSSPQALTSAVTAFEYSVRKKKFETSKPYSKPQRKFGKLMELLYEYYPRFNANVMIEQPRIMIRNRDSTDKKIHILTFASSQTSVHLRTTEDRNYDITYTVENLSATYSEKTDLVGADLTYFEASIFQLKNMSSKFMLYKNFMLSGDFKISATVIDMSELRVISGLNFMIDSFFLIAKNALDNGSLNSNLDSMIYVESKKFLLAVRHFDDLDDENDVPRFTSFKHFVLRFQSLPEWLLSVEVELVDTEVIFGSRSLLIPTSHLSDTYDNGLNFDSSGESHRLKAIKISTETVRAKIAKTNGSSSPQTPQSIHSISSTLVDNESTPTTYSEDATEDDHWEAEILLANVNTDTMLDLRSSQYVPLISIPEVNGMILSVGSSEQPMFKSDFKISEINVQYDKYKIFVVFGAANLLREFFIKPLKSIKSKLNKEIRVTREFSTLFQRKQRFSKSEANNFMEMISLNIDIDKSIFTLQLADDFTSIIQSYNSKLVYDKRRILMASGFSRVLRKVTKDGKKLLSRALCIDNLNVLLDELNLLNFDPIVGIESDGIRIIQPSGSVVYRFFDNLSIQISIIKCLLRAFKMDSNDRSRVILPTPSKPVQLPRIELRSSKILYIIEDDPLEAQINANYQLGLVEQKKRMELQYLFNQKIKDADPKDYQNELDNLNRFIGSSWIRKVKTFNMKFRKEIIDNRKNLFGSELKLPPKENANIEPSFSLIPLLTMVFDKVNLRISKPKFSQNDLMDFIDKMGVPKDSKYSVLIPQYLDLKLSEFRMHLRDYPLPLMHVPSTGNDIPGLHLRGNLVLAEQLLTSPEHLRELEVSLAPGLKSSKDNIYYSLLLKKSLATIKMYTDMTADFDLDLPTRIVWGHSYEFGLQQVLMNLDQFSKPPIDPSKKLGFWDKIRFILHGMFTLRSQKAIEVAFKGSNDPYDVLGTSSGFILSFERNVKWLINQNDTSVDFFNITSDKVSWYIPNYLVSPLYVWSRESSRTVYFPASKEVITSTFGYYLNDIATKPRRNNYNVLEKVVISLEGGIAFHVGFLLQRINSEGNVTRESIPHYDVSLWNPSYCESGHDSYKGFRSDYIHMTITLKAANKKCYNSFHLSPGVFDHFFKWWKLFNSATLIPIRKGKLFGETKAKAKFSQHLSTIKYLFCINSIFISHAYRSDASGTGSLDKINCVGLRAKLDDFVVDLHMRKEQTYLMNAADSERKAAQKMKMNLGEVHLSNIDLRIMEATFDQTIFDLKERGRSSPGAKSDTDTSSWYDVDDFNEVFMPPIQERGRDFTIKPLVFTKQFSYLRDTHTKSNFGSEDNHSCTLFKSNVFQPQIEIVENRIAQLQKNGKKKKAIRDHLAPRIEGLHRYKVECEKRWKKMTQDASIADNSSHKEQNGQYHNKFILINMLFKWNNVNRNFLYQYISLVKAYSSMAKYLSFACLLAVEDMIENVLEPASSGSSFLSTLNRRPSAGISNRVVRKMSSKERLDKFEDIMRFCLDNQVIQEDYELEIISPQIQLQSEQLEDTVILITAPKIDGKIVTALENKETELELSELETRYGILIPDASILMINKSDLHLDDFVFSEENYGAFKEWPPWLGIEVCRDVSIAKENRILVDKLSVMMTYDMLKPMGSQLTYYQDDSNSPSLLKDSKAAKFIQDRLQIDCPKLVISCTSEQYLNLYVIVLNLLFYSEPISKALQDKLEKLRFSLDLQNLHSLYFRLCNLHRYNALVQLLKRNYTFRNLQKDNSLLNDYILLMETDIEVLEEIYLLMRCFLTGDFSHNQSNFHAKDEWFIQADQIIFHLLEDDRTPIVDFAMAKGRFSRIVNENGSNKNKIEVGMVQGFNLVRGTFFSTLIQPFYDKADRSEWLDKDFLTINWTMNKSVGGIKILENFEIDFQPLNVNLDAVTGEKLIRYIFGEEENIEDSRLLKMNNSVLNSKEKGNNLLDDDWSKSDDESEHSDSHESKLAQSSKHKKSRNWLHHDASDKTSGSTSEFTHDESSDQVEEMIKRAGKYMSIGYFRISPVPVKISIQLRKYLRVLNVTDFVFNFPAMEIDNQILSLYDIANHLKASVMKTLWSHSGRLLLQKATKSRKKTTTRQLKPIQSYEEFRDVQTISSFSL